MLIFRGCLGRQCLNGFSVTESLVVAYVVQKLGLLTLGNDQTVNDELNPHKTDL